MPVYLVAYDIKDDEDEQDFRRRNFNKSIRHRSFWTPHILQQNVRIRQKIYAVSSGQTAVRFLPHYARRNAA